MPRKVARGLFCSALAVIVVRTPAAAQLGNAGIWGLVDTSRVVNLSIASSGGVSIGAYQAGASWMIAELLKFLRDHPEQRARFHLPRYRLTAFSGTSAGNVNALLTALQSCDAAPARPAEASALWDVWMQLGLEQLLPRHNGDPSLELGLLDRTYLNTVLRQRLRAEFSRPASPDCFVPIVATMSKLVPSRLSLNRLMAANVQRFVASYTLATTTRSDTAQFVLRAPEPLVQLDTALGKQVSLVTMESDGNQYELDQVIELLKASSSVAYLFAPVQLSYCDATAAAAAGGCRANGAPGARVEQARFVDGGAIDNAPLFAAIRLMELREQLAAAENGNGARPAHGTLLVSYDARRPRPGQAKMPFAEGAPPPPTPSIDCGGATGAERCGGIGALLQFLGGLMSSGGQFELQWLVRLRARDPVLRALDVDITTRQMPIAGEHLMNASGFIARPLREFDFQVGIYDALHFAASALLCRDEHRLPNDSLGPDRCVVDTLRGLVDRFPLSCQSALAVDLLLRHEYGIEWSEEVRERQLRETAHCDDSSIESRERALAYRSIFDAVTSVAEETAPPCPHSGFILASLCGEGTLHVLRLLRHDPVFYAYVRREAATCERAVAGAPPDDRMQTAAQCFATPAFVEALDDPARAFFTWIKRLLDRAQWLEEEVERRDPGPHPTLGWDVATQVVNLAARSALLSEETGPIAFPTVVPERRNAWRFVTGFVAPQEVALEALGNGWSFFWHPLSMRWSNGVAATVSGGMLRNGFAIAPDATHAGGRKTRLTASLRAGFRPVLRGNPVVSGIMLGARYVRPSPGDTDASRSRLTGQHVSPELRFDLFWDRLAVTLTRNPGYGDPDEQHRIRLAVSLMDPGGIAYWLMRSPSLR